MSAHYTGNIKSPQEICHNNPCWCGQHLPVSPPNGFDPYDESKAKQWLEKRKLNREKKQLDAEKKNARPTD